MHLVSNPGQFLSGGVDGGFVHVDEDSRCARRGECLRGCQAHPGTGSGHHSDLIGEVVMRCHVLGVLLVGAALILGVVRELLECYLGSTRTVAARVLVEIIGGR
jgi:hypothetical protein